MIGLAATTGAAAVRPALGREPRLGTNPIAVAAPTNKEPHFMLDMATCVSASGKIGLARRLGIPIPKGWAIDSEGQPLTEPPAARGPHWAQNPLGVSRVLGSHKGYGLAVAVDILTGVLSGGGFNTQLKNGENMTLGDGHQHIQFSGSGRVQVPYGRHVTYPPRYPT